MKTPVMQDFKMYQHNYHKEDLGNYSFLITGGAGFIGSNLAEYLLKYGAGKIRVLDNLSTGHLHNLQPFLSNPAFEFIQGDIRDLETCKDRNCGHGFCFSPGSTGICAQVNHRSGYDQRRQYFRFREYAGCVKEAAVKRVVYAASSSTYGDSTDTSKSGRKYRESAFSLCRYKICE